MKPAVALVIAALALAPCASAEPTGLEARIDSLAHDWAHANFEIPDKAAQALEASRVAEGAAAVSRQYPGHAEPLVWQAIALATEAGAKGGLGGLALAKQARALLEEAEKINPSALGDGSVYTSLGSLYAQVPGFPLGFGDVKKARAYLQKALAANPNGVDPNYFWGDFLMRQGDYAGSARALEKAISAPPRPGRDVADHGRRQQAQALLAVVRKKLQT
jgi:tetratricopeptide (TPR) repeat protein